MYKLEVPYMPFASCSCCVVVLNQQREQNISRQNQGEDVPVNNSKNSSKSCTVVENGRVVVKPVQPPVDETAE